MTWCISGDPRNPSVFVVECKGCHRHIPAGVDSFPRDNTRVDCPLCGEKRRYRPSEVYLGWPDQLLLKQQVQRAEHYRIERQQRKQS